MGHWEPTVQLALSGCHTPATGVGALIPTNLSFLSPCRPIEAWRRKATTEDLEEQSSLHFVLSGTPSIHCGKLHMVALVYRESEEGFFTARTVTGRQRA
jgi:hypothetical protein